MPRWKALPDSNSIRRPPRVREPAASARGPQWPQYRGGGGPHGLQQDVLGALSERPARAEGRDCRPGRGHRHQSRSPDHDVGARRACLEPLGDAPRHDHGGHPASPRRGPRSASSASTVAAPPARAKESGTARQKRQRPRPERGTPAAWGPAVPPQPTVPEASGGRRQAQARPSGGPALTRLDREDRAWAVYRADRRGSSGTASEPSGRSLDIRRLGHLGGSHSASRPATRTSVGKRRGGRPRAPCRRRRRRCPRRSRPRPSSPTVGQRTGAELAPASRPVAAIHRRGLRRPRPAHPARRVTSGGSPCTAAGGSDVHGRAPPAASPNERRRQEAGSGSPPPRRPREHQGLPVRDRPGPEVQRRDPAPARTRPSMGCSGELVTTAKPRPSARALVEVRYSKTCGAGPRARHAGRTGRAAPPTSSGSPRPPSASTPTRVLAHALRARRQELLWAGLVLFLWVVGLPLTGGLLVGFVVPSLLLAVAGWVRAVPPTRPCTGG
ncbi:hypothetical protein SALBM311S_00377 [Streptomyces alboniger]